MERRHDEQRVEYLTTLQNKCLISARYAGPIDCPLQTYAPEGEPLHSIVEEFADDQNAWLRDFLPVLEQNTYICLIIDYLFNLS